MIGLDWMKEGRTYRLAVAAGLVTSLAIFGSGVASADPGEPSKASCQGIEASFVAPPGSTSEAPGGNAEIAQINQSLGIPAGQEFKRWARAKLETHEECDSVLLGL